MLYAKAIDDTIRVSGFLDKPALVLVTCKSGDGSRRVVPFDCEAGAVSKSTVLKGFRVDTVVGIPLLKTRQPLYVYRTVRNGDEISDWFKSQGMASTQDPADMHVTVAYSKKAVEWEALGPEEDGDVEIEPCLRRSMIPLGDKGAIVMRVDSPKLTSRWQHFIQKGASWDYEGYQPHITITYMPGTEAARFVPFPGTIMLGKERFQKLSSDFTPAIKNAFAGLEETADGVGSLEEDMKSIIALALKAADERKSPPEGYPKDKSQYALPDTYEFPIDGSHIHAAISYFHKHRFESEGQKRSAARRILAAAKRHGVEVSDDSDVARAAHETKKAADERQSPPKGYPTDKDQYALPDTYEFPIDASHIHAAISYFSSHHFDSAAQRRGAATKILNAARHHGVHVSDNSDVARAAHGT